MSDGGLRSIDLGIVPFTIDTISSGSGPQFFFDAVFADGVVYAADLVSRAVVAIDTVTGSATELLAPPLLNGFSGVDYDEASDSLYVIDTGGAASRYPLPAGPLESINTATPGLASATGLAVADDAAFTTTTVVKSVGEIDLSSGVTTTLAASGVGTGPTLSGAFAGKYDSANERLVVHHLLGVAAFEPGTGRRTELLSIPPLPVFIGLPSLALDLAADGNSAWITNLGGDTVSSANLVAGTIDEVSGPNVGTGPDFSQISGLTVNAAGSVAYVADGGFAPRVLRVDLASGDRELVLQLASIGLVTIRDLLLDEAEDRLILDMRSIGLQGSFEIATLELGSLNQTTLANYLDGQPQGPTLIGTARLGRRNDDIYHLLHEAAGGLVGKTELGSGASIAFSRLEDPGPYPLGPSAPVPTESGALYVIDSVGAIFVVDEATGARVIVSL